MAPKNRDNTGTPASISTIETWVVYSDGSAVPNPGRMGLGATWTAPDGTCHHLSVAAQGHGCNNEAELRAVMAALGQLKLQGAANVLLHCDNSVVVEQLAGHSAPPIERLAALFDDARALLDSFEQARVVWLPRHRNREADELARAAVGLAPKATAAPRKRRR